MPETFKTLVELLEKSCRKYANNQLFGVKRHGAWQWTSFREFGEMVDECRGGLARLGVKPGDRVSIVSDNSLPWATSCYATFSLGATFVPMYQSQLAPEWEYILKDSGAKVVIGATEDIYQQLLEVQPRCPNLAHVVGVGLPDEHEHSFSHLMRDGQRHPSPSVTPEETAIAGFIYTSGTTGNPKGVVLTHKNLCSNLHSMQQRFPFTNDVSLAFLPWTHCFGQICELHNMLSMGCAMAINDDVKNLIVNLAEVRPTILIAVPRIFNRIYDGVTKQMESKPAVIQSLFESGMRAARRKTRGEVLSFGDQAAHFLADKLIFSKVRARFGGRLRLVVSGSAALSTEVAEFVDALGVNVYEGYGLTETSPVVSANYEGHRKLGSVGLPVPNVTVKLDKTVVDEPGVGEILVYGDLVMQGYHNTPEETAQVLMADGGFRTGDLGRIDSDGYITITGRIKEQYKLENGKYVVPALLEEQFKLSPYIANIMLYGANRPANVALVVADEARIQQWAERKGRTIGDVTTDAAIHALLVGELERLGVQCKGYERPRRLKVITEDFTTENGMLTPSFKIKRRAVLERYGAALEALY